MLYQPRHFAVSERAALLELVRAHPFATLVSVHDGQPSFTHLPLEVDERQGLKLIGHVAHANPHWKQWGEGAPATAIFRGADAYVSPGWYTAREAVPTWNYMLVHAYGHLTVTHDSAVKERILKTLIDRHDPAYHTQWDELGEEYRERMKRGIVGLQIEVERLEGKFKLGQNRSVEDQAAVRAAHAQGDAAARELAEWMQRLGMGSQ